MAAKIKEGLRDITHGVVERLKGGPKYADNLLGESLQDQLRKATAKDLLGPNEEMNSQVAETINQDISNGKDSKEIVGLLKKRLRTDNPHKQWLAVLLVGRVMKDCNAAIGMHQEELLQEVARVMARPARPESSSGKTTRQAAKELLRSYGRAGAGAFRAVNRTAATAATAAEYAAASASSEAASVVAEVEMLIEQAHANTELLSEMLLVADPQQQAGAAGGSAGQPGDEFENELTLELVTEVRELRTLFDAYLEQLQALSGPDVEAVMMKALEAVDLLDGALALQQDVASNQRELEQQATAGAAAAGAAAAGGSGQPAAAAAAAAQPAERERNLIDLDDLSDALPPQPPPGLDGVAAAGAAAAAPQPQQPKDPFATLDVTQISSPSTTTPLASPPAAPQQGAYPAGLYASTSVPAAAPAAYPPQNNPFAYGQQPPGQPPQQAPYGMYGAPYGGVPAPPAASLAVSHVNNPFANPQMPPEHFGSVPQPLPGTYAANSNNPFAGSAAAAAPPQPLPATASSGGAQSVDAEWAMFFAGRTGPAAAAGFQQQPQQVGAAPQ